METKDCNPRTDPGPQSRGLSRAVFRDSHMLGSIELCAESISSALHTSHKAGQELVRLRRNLAGSKRDNG